MLSQRRSIFHSDIPSSTIDVRMSRLSLLLSEEY
jgi:hypothetical protein